MLRKPEECNGCELVNIGRGFLNPSGSPNAQIIGIGESAGDEEAWRGRPFVETAQAGGKLEECLKLAGITREEIKLWNICGCQPMEPKNSLGGRQDAIDHCKVHFDRVVLGHAPAIGCRETGYPGLWVVLLLVLLWLTVQELQNGVDSYLRRKEILIMGGRGTGAKTHSYRIRPLRPHLPPIVHQKRKPGVNAVIGV